MDTEYNRWDTGACIHKNTNFLKKNKVKLKKNFEKKIQFLRKKLKLEKMLNFYQNYKNQMLRKKSTLLERKNQT